MDQLCSRVDLYPENFVIMFGQSDPNWSRNGWFQREASLRHDMVCILLCNLTPLEALSSEALSKILVIPEHTEESGGASTSTGTTTTSSDAGIIDQGYLPNTSQIESLDFDENLYRYFLLEGRSNQTHIQNQLCQIYHIPVLSRQYDIFDRQEKKFIEVKVTKNYDQSLQEYLRYPDPREFTCLIHVNPDDPSQWHDFGKDDEMHGKGKATSFLLKRCSIMRTDLHLIDSDIDMDHDLPSEIFKSKKLNVESRKWSNHIWKERNMVLKPEDFDHDPTPENLITKLSQQILYENIEDTSLRDAEIMKLHCKVLPPPIIQTVKVNGDKDLDILIELVNETVFDVTNEKGVILNEIVSAMRAAAEAKESIFQFKSKKMSQALQRDMGIDMKKTLRYDGHPDLKQPDYDPPQKAKYHPWMSHLLRDLGFGHNLEGNFNDDLATMEMPSDHPMAIVADEVISKYYRSFGRAQVSLYANLVKGVYSRLGGAFIVRGKKSARKGNVAIFPIYATTSGAIVNRYASGFIIRGPSHAKSPTDRIPIITVELINPNCVYYQCIKKPNFLYDNMGRLWCYRVNSILKQDPTYLTFVQNSTYLAANFIGELTINNPNIPATFNAVRESNNFIGAYSPWLMERCIESVMMAVLGGSQEEGALAIVRKMFMLKLNWHRGNDAYGCDMQGLAEALNECLIDHPLALYFGQQIRLFLAPA